MPCTALRLCWALPVPHRGGQFCGESAIDRRGYPELRQTRRCARHLVESHYRWQIRTFWFAALWLIVAVAFVLTLVGVPLGFGILIAVTVWLIYRIARGWLRLVDKQPMPN